jgi:hypothetical protein
MSARYPGGWLDRAAGACLAILAGAVAIFVAVKLIEAVAGALLIIVALTVFVGVVIAILRGRNRGW